MLLRHALGAALRRIRLDDGRTLREVARGAALELTARDSRGTEVSLAAEA